MATWQKLRILGKGSYGIVYLARVIAPGEGYGILIAVKSSKGYAVNSLLKEGSILDSFIGCKEIVQCIWRETTIENGEPISNLLMEYAPYGSLGDLIKKGTLLENEARVYTRMLLKGLSRIHQSGVVHCDLKPDNILLFPSSENGVRFQVKIADFGLSRTREEKSNADDGKITFRGTPLYMSPESVMGQIETPLDIWSLGCIVIEMITGLPAWGKILTKEDIMFKLAFLKAPEIPNCLSQNCRDFLSKCFVKDPQDRWTANMLLSHPFLLSPYDTCRGYQIFPRFSSFFSYDCDLGRLRI